jgi:hypothetical protein
MLKYQNDQLMRWNSLSVMIRLAWLISVHLDYRSFPFDLSDLCHLFIWYPSVHPLLIWLKQNYLAVKYNENFKTATQNTWRCQSSQVLLLQGKRSFQTVFKCPVPAKAVGKYTQGWFVLLIAKCRIPRACHEKRSRDVEQCPERVVISRFWLINRLRVTPGCNFWWGFSSWPLRTRCFSEQTFRPSRVLRLVSFFLNMRVSWLSTSWRARAASVHFRLLNFLRQMLHVPLTSYHWKFAKQ